MLKKLFKESGSIIGYLFGIIGTAVTIYFAPGSITMAVRWLVIIGFVMLAPWKPVPPFRTHLLMH